jgi:hypothetical protein
MKLWAQVNKVINKKNVTKSINSFMKNLWIDINRELGISKKGKIKFKEFSNFCDKIKNDLKKTTDFKANFEKYVENFAWFALSNNEIWSVNNSNNSKEWQYFQACNYLIRDCGIKDRFEDEIRKKINEYKANYESIFRLFLLYFFTYIIEGYTYSSSANKKVDEFEQLDENGRKDKIFDLWTRIKNENILDKTYYNVKSITGEISNIKKIHKTIRTWLILGNCSPNLHDFYAFVNQNREKVLDHYFPKNPTHKGFGGAKKIDKNVSDKILDDIKNDKEFSKKLNSLYNIVLLNNGVNCWKNNTVPSEFLEESDDGMITNIKYDELEKRWVVNKTQIIKNIDIIVDRLKR